MTEKHSLRSQSYDKSIASSTASSQQCAILCFCFQLPISSFSLRLSSSCLRLLHCLSVLSIFSSIKCFYATCKHPINLTSFSCTQDFFSSLTLCNISFFTQLAPLSPFSSSITFQGLHRITDLFSEASKLQHQETITN
jgi:hypothetical protein